YTSSDSQVTRPGPPESDRDDATILTLDPKQLHDGETVVLTTHYEELANGVAVAGIGVGVAKGEVKPCELYDPTDGPTDPPSGD
ncbi:MAG: hypothetical protein ACRD0P_36245, partial [Stackebrandtia sp.]